MVGNKGFIHIIEAVLISVVAIALIPSIFQTATPSEDWSRTKLRVMGRDMLASLENRDVLNNITSYNRSETSSLLGGVLGDKKRFIQYSLRTERSYRKSIRVGFNCTGCDAEEETSDIKKVLRPVWLNGRMIKFTVLPFKWKNFTGTGKNYNLDVIFLNGKGQVNEAKYYTGKIRTHLSRGKGVVEYAEISSPGAFQQEIFGIESGSDSSGDLSFRNRENASRLNYEPSKVFYGVGSTVEVVPGGDDDYWRMRGDPYVVEIDDTGNYEVTVKNSTGYEFCSRCEEGESFSIGEFNFTVEKVIEFRNGNIVWFRHEEEPNGYNFSSSTSSNLKPLGGEWERSVLDSGTDESGFVVNRTGRQGRTAWVTRGDGDDVEGLVQSAVIWASERGSWNYLRSPGTNSVQVSRFGINDKEIYEPYLVVLNLWYIY